MASGSTGSCGAATTRTTRARIPTRPRACGWSSPEPTRRVAQVLAGNAAAVYGFDLDALVPLAAKVGPTVDELNTPLATIPADATSPAFYRA